MAYRRLMLVCGALLVATVWPLAAETLYDPDKVVYDLSSSDPSVLSGLLDRAGALQRLYGNDPFEASIVFVVHEGALPLFARGAPAFQAELMQRAESLALGEVVQFRLCEMSARSQGLEPDAFPSFARQVPMADAELVRLQHAGYAYLR